ncbi:pteridine reductase [Marinobacter sp. es.042]|uniref:pteridine reductase n=1 Tax=Marinobacter sp. es.042 TaxID=1761794 RepID=UPI000B50CA37|nr:pteridine reductase [Marinobacter sp. es.042]SNB53854.1 pteridine reductase [Marinobacter sp. es.042]
MPSTTPVALITGAAHRLGAQTARTLHERGWNLVIHYRSREEQANSLIAQMNRQRPDSACALQADLNQLAGVDRLASDAVAQWGRLDALVNNASVFYPTPTSEATEDDWNTILNTNLRAPFFLLQGCLAELRRNRGSVVNLIDIYSERPIDDHPLYCATKAGLAALTRSWAKDLAPDVRVNGVSPGAILWPEGEAEMDQSAQQAILQKTPLARTGNLDDISETVAFLICDAPFITGQIVSVDGGRSLNM